ncbi:MAG: DUF4126 domain-containing protein [Anaerolineae bacterium]
MGAIMQIFQGFGLSAASGLNAYIPLLVVGLAARFTNWVQLSPPFDALTNEWVLGTLVVLELIEVFVDKIPGLDHINDVIQTFVRPTAGAVLFASEAHVITNLNPVIAVILGLVVAFGVHATKATVRPVVTAGTLGTGNWLVSIAEDIVSVLVSTLAIIAPVLLGLLLVVFIWLLFRWRSNRAAKNAAMTSGSGNPPLKWPH